MLIYMLSVVALLLASLTHVDTWNISVDHDQKGLPRDSLRFLCVTDVPLIACQVRVYDDRAQTSHAHDLSLADQSQAVDVINPDGSLLYTAGYHGSGLRAGQCGIMATSSRLQYVIATCRVRADIGGWREETVAFNRLSEKRTGRTTHEVVVQGENRTVQCESPALRVCELQLPGAGKHVDLVTTAYDLSRTSNRSFIYEHSGSGSVCKFDLLNMTDADAGPVWCETLNEPNKILFTTTIFALQKLLKSPPKLTLSLGTTYEDGDFLTATCTVADTMPVAKISWRLGSALIEGESVTEVARDEWALPWEGEARTQRVSIKVSLQDNNRDLKCIATQLDKRKQSKMMISVTAQQGCGKRNVQPSLISKGQSAHPGEFPWHVGLYKLEFGSYQHLCGGSLITKMFVITAAHCFQSLTNGQVPDLHAYKMAVGKHHRDYAHVDVGVQASDLANVSVPFNYLGVRGNYQHDIAVVRLVDAVRLGTNVRVVCVDWDNEFASAQLAAGRNGIIAGWGLQQDRAPGKTLQWVALPWVPQHTCKAAVPVHKLQYLTYDKLCAGYLNTSVSVCAGDSGGGLVFRNEATDRYYLRGVSSVSFDVNPDRTCFTRLYAGFTDVSVYRQWIGESVR